MKRVPYWELQPLSPEHGLEKFIAAEWIPKDISYITSREEPWFRKGHLGLETTHAKVYLVPGQKSRLGVVQAQFWSRRAGLDLTNHTTSAGWPFWIEIPFLIERWSRMCPIIENYQLLLGLLHYSCALFSGRMPWQSRSASWGWGYLQPPHSDSV